MTLQDGSVLVCAIDGAAQLILDPHGLVVKLVFELPVSSRFDNEARFSRSPGAATTVEVAQMHAVLSAPEPYCQIVSIAMEYQMRMRHHLQVLSLLRTGRSQGAAIDTSALSRHAKSSTVSEASNEPVLLEKFVTGSLPSLEEGRKLWEECTASVEHMVDPAECSYVVVPLPVDPPCQSSSPHGGHISGAATLSTPTTVSAAQRAAEHTLEQRRDLALCCVRNGEIAADAGAWEGSDHADARSTASGPNMPRDGGFGFAHPDGKVVDIQVTPFATYFFRRASDTVRATASAKAVPSFPDGDAGAVRSAQEALLQVVLHADQSVCLVTCSSFGDEFVFYYLNSPPSGTSTGSDAKDGGAGPLARWITLSSCLPQHAGNKDAGLMLGAAGTTRLDDVEIAGLPLPVNRRLFGLPCEVFTIGTAPHSVPSAESFTRPLAWQPTPTDQSECDPSETGGLETVPTDAPAASLARILMHGKLLLQHNLRALARQRLVALSRPSADGATSTSFLQDDPLEASGQSLAHDIDAYAESGVERGGRKPFSAEVLLSTEVPRQG
eukprot:INCI7611.11.p1 GENE.INCI7611.11~~INCI7611.11.p1  ORF type:complete len:553 (+),score=74.26 INCI7611.11:818-2476(+)